MPTPSVRGLYQCAVCAKYVVRRGGRACPPCAALRASIRAAHLAGGDAGGPPHPDLAARLALYAARAAAGEPLFPERRRP